MNNNKKYISSLLRHNWLLLFSLFMSCVGICLMLMAIIWTPNEEILPQETIFEPLEKINPTEVPIVVEYKTENTKEPIVIDDIHTIAQNEYFIKMLELDCGEISKEEWYLGYKQLVCEYEEYLELPKTIYDVFTEDEIYLIQRAVETEVFQAGFDSKVNVASVIFNRINDGRFGNTVKEVITNPGQFAYHREKISDSTILAVEYAFEIGDTTGGCIAFRSDRKPEKWGKWVYSFSDDAVHHFYKELGNEDSIY